MTGTLPIGFILRNHPGFWIRFTLTISYLDLTATLNMFKLNNMSNLLYSLGLQDQVSALGKWTESHVDKCHLVLGQVWTLWWGIMVLWPGLLQDMSWTGQIPAGPKCIVSYQKNAQKHILSNKQFYFTCCQQSQRAAWCRGHDLEYLIKGILVLHINNEYISYPLRVFTTLGQNSGLSADTLFIFWIWLHNLFVYPPTLLFLHSYLELESLSMNFWRDQLVVEVI